MSYKLSLSLLLFVFIGCGAPTMAERASDPSCTVINQDDGTITIKCPDGTEANIDPQLVEGTDAGVDDAVTSDDATSDDATSDDATSDDATSESDAGFDDVEQVDDAGTNDVEERIMYGSYTIQNSVDLANLVGYTKVTGNLFIVYDGVVSLEGLESLREVEGDFYIPLNSLHNLQGLNNLERVGERFRLHTVANIDRGDATLSGLESLTSVGALEILNLRAPTVYLPSLAEVTGIDYPGYQVYIAGNINLPHCLILELVDQIESRRGINVPEDQININNNMDPCAPEDLCAGGICTEDCSAPEFYTCQ